MQGCMSVRLSIVLEAGPQKSESVTMRARFPSTEQQESGAVGQHSRHCSWLAATTNGTNGKTKKGFQGQTPAAQCKEVQDAVGAIPPSCSGSVSGMVQSGRLGTRPSHW